MELANVGISSSLDIKHIPCPKAPLTWRARNFVKHLAPDYPRLIAAHMARQAGVPVLLSRLSAKKRDKNGKWTDYGVLSTKFVTNNGVAFLVDAWQNIVELEIMKYHGVGTGTTAENVADSALVTESTTILNPDSTRATGSLAEGASGNIFRSVGTVTFDGSGAITEHGLFSQAATGGGVLWDRSVFSAINVISGDSIQFTYDVTFTAGS